MAVDRFSRMRTAHRITNIDSPWHGLYCACGQRPCAYRAKSPAVPEPEPPADPVEAFWASLPHEKRAKARSAMNASDWEAGRTAADVAYRLFANPTNP